MHPAPWLTVTADPAPAMLDGSACRTRAAFFEEVARVLDFPPYFGHNWDAVVDSLRDIGAVDLSVSHAEQLLADEPSEQFVILLRIMATAAADGFTLALHTSEGRLPALRERIETALR